MFYSRSLVDNNEVIQSANEKEFDVCNPRESGEWYLDLDDIYGGPSSSEASDAYSLDGTEVWT